MALDATQLAALKTELTTDPLSLGYGSDHSTDAADADLLNARTFVVNKASVPCSSIRAAVPYDEYDGLSIDEQEWIRWLTNDGGDLAVTAEVVARLTKTSAQGGIWAVADTDAPAAILALIQRPGSRAEVLFGLNVYVTPSDVANARNLP